MSILYDPNFKPSEHFIIPNSFKDAALNAAQNIYEMLLWFDDLLKWELTTDWNEKKIIKKIRSLNEFHIHKYGQFFSAKDFVDSNLWKLLLTFIVWIESDVDNRNRALELFQLLSHGDATFKIEDGLWLIQFLNVEWNKEFLKKIYTIHLHSFRAINSNILMESNNKEEHLFFKNGRYCGFEKLISEIQARTIAVQPD